ncbi:hypothetical protein CO179_02335, partial [candidate division WWE3 bacterium CG_4_9_14_3_um_filter_39_7]
YLSIGIVFILLSLIPNVKQKCGYLWAIGFGVIIEEWPIILSDMGFNTKPLYLKPYDYIFVPVAIGLFFLVRNIFYRAQNTH